MFDDRREEKEKEKLKKKLRKHALREQAKWEAKKREAEKIKDDNYVQSRLLIEKQKDEELLRKRDRIVQRNLAEALGADIDHFKCKVCGADVSLSNLTCPNCGQLYCQYCGAPLDMENPGVCPRCGGIPYYQPAELVITRVEDLPPEERFWEELPTCPKCGATVQPDWDSCPICGAKLSPSKKPTGDQIDTGVWTEEELEKVQPKQPEKLESAKAVKRRMRKEKGKKGKSGV